MSEPEIELVVPSSVTPELIVDLKAERYEQRTNWRIGGNGSIGLDPFRATWLQDGLEKRF